MWPLPRACFCLPLPAFPEGPASIFWVCTDPLVCLFHGRMYISVPRLSASVALSHWTVGFICRNQIFQVPQDPLIVPSAGCFTLQAPLRLQPFRRAIRIYTAWSSQGFGCLASAVRPSTSCPEEHGSLWCHKSSSCGAEALKVYPPKWSHILMETSSWCSESVSMWTLSAWGGYVSSQGSGTGFGTGCLELNLGSASARFAS